MRFYIIAGALFVTAFVVLGVLTATVINGPQPPSRPQAAKAPAARGTPQGAALPSSASPGSGAGRPGYGMAGAPGTGTPGNSGSGGLPPIPGAPGLPSPVGLTPGMPHAPSQSQSVSVPIIQPTDLGTPSSPTAGRSRP